MPTTPWPCSGIWPSGRPPQRLDPALVVTTTDGHTGVLLEPATINRVLAAVSSLYEFLIMSDQLGRREHPIEKRPDRSYARVTDRYQPLMDHSSRQRPLRRAVRVKTVERLPRPLSDEYIQALLSVLRCRRDEVFIRLMLEGGLRPAEALGLHLEDIAYGRRRVVVRHPNRPSTARCRQSLAKPAANPTGLASLSQATSSYAVCGLGRQREKGRPYQV